MSSKATSLKARIRNYAQRSNIAAQVVLQNYMFERLLERLSLSEFNQHFVIKGGMLIAAIVGLDTRSTMDLDVTLRRLPLIETVMAEKVETILSRGVFNTRLRDYYDIYILGTTQEYDISTFREALAATSVHRGSREKIKKITVIIGLIAENRDLEQGWFRYQRKFSYAADISYESIMTILKHLVL